MPHPLAFHVPFFDQTLLLALMGLAVVLAAGAAIGLVVWLIFRERP